MDQEAVPGVAPWGPVSRSRHWAGLSRCPKLHEDEIECRASEREKDGEYTCTLEFARETLLLDSSCATRLPVSLTTLNHSRPLAWRGCWRSAIRTGTHGGTHPRQGNGKRPKFVPTATARHGCSEGPECLASHTSKVVGWSNSYHQATVAPVDELTGR